MQDLLRLFERGAHRDGDQVLLGHHIAHGNVRACFKAQVAVGQDADQPLALGHRHAGDLVAPHNFEGVRDELLRPDGDWIDDHAALRTLHLVDLACLLLNGQVSVDNADAPVLCHRNGQPRFGHGVHGGGE
jgi:hypothetical protein